MSAEPDVPVIESDKSTVVDGKDIDHGLLEVGSVSGKTKGSPLGNAVDTSGADWKFGP